MKAIKVFITCSILFASLLTTVFAGEFNCHCDFTTAKNVLVKAEKNFSDLKSINGQLPCAYKDMHISMETDFSTEPTIHFVVHRGAIVKGTKFGKPVTTSSFRVKSTNGLRDGFSVSSAVSCSDSNGAKCVHARVSCEQK